MSFPFPETIRGGVMSLLTPPLTGNGTGSG